MPPLDRAIALEQVDEVAVVVAQDLDFEMPGTLDELFEEDVGHAERGPRLASWPPRSPRSSPSAESTTRIPRPPPPIDALTITG